MSEDRGDWFNRHRMLTVGIFLLIVWSSIFWLLWMKTDEVTMNPCNVCAKKLGNDLSCYSYDGNSIIYSPSGGQEKSWDKKR